MIQKKSGHSTKILADKLIGKILHRTKGPLSIRDSILFSLAVGFSQDPLKQQDLKYTYENHQDFVAFPTIVAALHRTNILKILGEDYNMPIFNPFVVLHVQQIVTMIKDKIQIGGQLEHQATLIDVIDKGKNALIWAEIRSYVIENGKRQLVSIASGSLLFKGLGGFGFKGRNLFSILPQVPERKPDIIKNVYTYPNQAIYFSLTGDRNPLHILPKVAKSQHFQRPILHGMATYGSIVRVFIQQILNNNQSRFKSFHTKFIGFVYPGQTLTLNIWKENQLHYFVQALTKQRNTRVLIGRFYLKPQTKL